MANCLHCKKPETFFSVNYAGMVFNVAKVSVAPTPLPGIKPEFLCGDCVPKVAKVRCSVHAQEELAFTVNASVLVPSGACPQCDPVAASRAAASAGDSARAAELQQVARERAADAAERLGRIYVTTGPALWPYEVVGLVTGSGATGNFAGILTGGGSGSFQQAEAALRAEAASLGADAVVHAVFNHRVAGGKDLGGSAVAAIEYHAYGTAVRRVAPES